MTLRFPNPNRSFDATRCAVRFWGHDGALEASFFVTDDALRRVGRKGSYELVAADF